MYYDQNNRNKNNLCGGGSDFGAGFHIRRGQTHHGPGLLPEVYRRTGGKAGDGFGTNGGLHSGIGGAVAATRLLVDELRAGTPTFKENR